jgi:hypothetical protein
MSSNRKYKAWKKHSNCNNDRSSKSIPDTSIHQATLITNKRCENNEWCWQNIANGDTVEEYAGREPSAL